MYIDWDNKDDDIYLYFIGDKICKMLDDKLAEHVAVHGKLKYSSLFYYIVFVMLSCVWRIIDWS